MTNNLLDRILKTGVSVKPGKWFKLDEETPTIFGLLVNIRLNKWETGYEYDIQTQDGEVRSVSGSRSIDDQIPAHALGELIAVSYEGRSVTKTGRPFKNFTVTLAPTQAGDDKLFSYTGKVKAQPFKPTLKERVDEPPVAEYSGGGGGFGDFPEPEEGDDIFPTPEV